MDACSAWCCCSLGVPECAVLPCPPSMPSAIVSRTMPPAIRKSSTATPKNPRIALPATMTTSDITRLYAATRIAVLRCRAASYPAVNQAR